MVYPEMTKRQKAYRAYLKTDHWKALRDLAVERDCGKCVRCGSPELLQVHHLKYRGEPESTILEDLETLCRQCHRLTHGIGPTEIEMLVRKMEMHMNRIEKPPVSDWKRLYELVNDNDSIIIFGEVMFQYVNHVWSHIRENFARDWWMDKNKNRFWFERAFRVRKSIWERAE